MTDIDWQHHEERARSIYRSLSLQKDALDRAVLEVQHKRDLWEAHTTDLLALQAYLKAIQAEDSEALALAGLVYGPDLIGAGSEL